jgi:hypothetical protein
MIVRVYTYRFAYPADAAKFTETMDKAADMLVKHNKYVMAVDMVRDEDDVVLKLTMQGHDQWWIKKRVIHPIGALLTRCGIKLKDARLIAVDKPGDLRVTRPRASDGRSNALAEDVMVDHADMMA